MRRSTCLRIRLLKLLLLTLSASCPLSCVAETALLHCQFYLRSSGLYTPVEHLPEIGQYLGGGGGGVKGGGGGLISKCPAVCAWDLKTSGCP